MTRCLIVVNGFLKSQKFSELYHFIVKTGEKLGIETKIIENNAIIPIIADEVAKSLNLQNKADFVLFLDKDVFFAEHLALSGLSVFNSARTIAVCDNKIKTSLALLSKKIPQPKTIFSPFTFFDVKPEIDKFLYESGNYLGYPLILKEATGSFGKQVYWIDSYEALLKKSSEIKNAQFLLQEVIMTSVGKDVRLNIVGDTCVSAVLRMSCNDFRANATLGSTLIPYKPTGAEINLAVNASQAVGAAFSGVDLLFGKESSVVCEVNSNPHLLSAYNCTGINVAEHILKFCQQSTS